ncbi:MAG: hypothetical protein LIO97_06540 [Tannerellaceae bacterium]|nr:hypothetical protein [Tannerellaceae bacterium]
MLLGEDAVAAFSVACYCFSIVFMINNAIAQLVRPIISYNYGVEVSVWVYDVLEIICCQCGREWFPKHALEKHFTTSLPFSNLVWKLMLLPSCLA